MVFAANFTLGEFTRVAERSPSDVEIQKAARLSQLLEICRHALGDQAIILTSWLRRSGADGTAHATGDAVDFRPPRSLSQREIFDRVTTALRESGAVFGECIFYPFTDWHIHLTLYPAGGRNQVLLALADGSYRLPDSTLLASVSTTPAPFPPSAVSSIVLVALGAGVVASALLVS